MIFDPKFDWLIEIENVFIDMDGVLVDNLQTGVKYRNEIHNDPVKFEDLLRLSRVNEETRTLRPLTINDKYYLDYYYENPIWFDDAEPFVNALHAAGKKMFTMSVSEEPERKGRMISKKFGEKVVPKFSPDCKSKEQCLRQAIIKYKLNTKRTLFIDDNIVCIRQAMKIAGLRVARKMDSFAHESHSDLKDAIPHFYFLEDLQNRILGKRE